MHRSRNRRSFRRISPTRHMVFGMGGRRPAGVYKEVNATRGHFRQLDQTVRRIHPGWEVKVTPNDDGVRVVSGLWYNTAELRKRTDSHRGKVSVFVVPDDIKRVTVLIPGGDEPVGGSRPEHRLRRSDIARGSGNYGGMAEGTSGCDQYLRRSADANPARSAQSTADRPDSQDHPKCASLCPAGSSAAGTAGNGVRNSVFAA